MNYPELAQFNSTPDQDLALNIAFKMAVAAGHTIAATPGAYLADRVAEVLTNYDQQYVTGEKLARMQQALTTAFASKDAAVATAAIALSVDLTIVAPK